MWGLNSWTTLSGCNQEGSGCAGCNQHGEQYASACKQAGNGDPRSAVQTAKNKTVAVSWVLCQLPC